jgi:hypothetical protein
MTELWITGRWYYQRRGQRPLWSLGGIFSTKEKAIAATREPTDFIAPWTLDQDLMDDNELMRGLYYPLTEEGPPNAG